jgi:SAM-dependent methyltransferase
VGGTLSERFADHFSEIAAAYARFRPGYPDALFAWLADVAPGRELVWECGAGSGQATLGLAAHFARVVATDASAAQLAGAPAHPRVEYRSAPAEASGLPCGACDLVAVAQALHWFPLEAFYAEASRVLRPGGVIAAWTYGHHRVDEPGVNRLVREFYTDIVGPFWPPERRHVEAGYRTLPFPFAELPAPRLELEAFWTLEELLGYLRTWSATARYVAERGVDPVAELAPAIAAHWGPPGRRRHIVWPLALRAGRVGG